MSMHPIRHAPQAFDMTRRLQCSEIWGGIGNVDDDLEVGPVSMSLFSAASDGAHGGDIYYFSVCDDEAIVRIAVADVVGHGAGATRVSSWLYDALSANMSRVDGSAVLLELNEVANQVGLEAMTTAAVLSFEVTDSTLHLANAGHPPVWIHRVDEQAWRPQTQPSQPTPTLPFIPAFKDVPLGVSAETTYDQERVPLRAGDRFLIHTDGLIEASDGTGKEFGDEGLRAVLSKNRNRSVADLKHDVLAAVREHTGGTLGHDDVTLMLAELR